jgi:hypothetical protein
MAGGASDFWQRDVTDMGETGPDHARGARYLTVGPGQTAPMALNNVVFGVRSLEPDPGKSKALIAKLNIYPFSQRKNPPPAKLMSPGGKL